MFDSCGDLLLNVNCVIQNINELLIEKTAQKKHFCAVSSIFCSQFGFNVLGGDGSETRMRTFWGMLAEDALIDLSAIRAIILKLY